jgi:hypothetical protein
MEDLELMSALIRALLTVRLHVLDGAYAEAVLLQVGLNQLCEGVGGVR